MKQFKKIITIYKSIQSQEDNKLYEKIGMIKKANNILLEQNYSHLLIEDLSDLYKEIANIKLKNGHISFSRLIENGGGIAWGFIGSERTDTRFEAGDYILSHYWNQASIILSLENIINEDLTLDKETIDSIYKAKQLNIFTGFYILKEEIDGEDYYLEDLQKLKTIHETIIVGTNKYNPNKLYLIN